jgi:gas vesicle protein GvpA/GvpJ/GvpM family
MDSPPARVPAERIALVDLLDRLLAGGVVVSGEITLSVADVDLVTISLRALLASVGSLGKDYVGAEPATQSGGSW